MKFKPEDFKGPFKDGSTGLVTAQSHEPLFTAEMCAHNANIKLQEWLDAAPTVCGNNEPYFGSQWNFEKKPEHTHKAKLVCIEEIK